MIDSKKLAATPLTEYDIGSDEFCMTCMAHHDAGVSLVSIALTLRITLQRVTHAVNKGRRIRDRLIRENSEAVLKAIQEGTCPVPRVTQEVPDVKVVAVSFVCPPRGLDMQRLHEPIKMTHVAPMTVQ